VVNYDLPWNPQRIEQRIGRCHRYGQKHDVVVVNFLNRNNAADVHVFRLLSEKFQLFEGVFGASDEVLGAIESGVDFEKRIAGIYQKCRRPDEIKIAFDQLQLELAQEIDEAMTRTRRKLLENFDDEVREKLRIRDEASKAYLSRFERLLILLTHHELAGHADFIGDSAFRLNSSPFASVTDLGLYELPRRSGDAHLYRLNHPLAEAILDRAKQRQLASAQVRFNYGEYDGKISHLERLRGQQGWLTLSRFTFESFDQSEDHLICAGKSDSGEELDIGTLAALFLLPAQTNNPTEVPDSVRRALDAMTFTHQTGLERGISERNARFFEAEAQKLDGWADDLKMGLEREIKDLDRQIKEARRAATTALTLDEKLAGQKQIKALEAQRNDKRRSLFEAQDRIDLSRDELISEIEGKLLQRKQISTLFSIRWELA
jgi:adenine-specific DNA-methyltransferase